MRHAPFAALLAALPLLALAETPAAAPAAAPAARLTLDEVVRRALAASASARAARARRDAAGADASSLRGRMLPGVTVSDDAQRWDSAFSIPFPGAPGGIVARDESTNTFTAAAGQPILGLLHLGADV